MKRIVVAPNAFKHALDAKSVAEAISEGFRRSNLTCQLLICPIGDGGDGTCRLIHDYKSGEKQKVAVHDALGRPIESNFSIIDEGETAVIEMADSVGLRQLDVSDYRPLGATSIGTGEVIKKALDSGVSKIILGMGGSATIDGGCGLLYALGMRFLNKNGESLYPIPQMLANVVTVAVDTIDDRLLSCELIILCDVENRLLGKNGAAAVFGAQKGAGLSDINSLEKFLEKWRNIGLEMTGKDMNSIIAGGTAGGAAAGMYVYADAQLVNGIDFYLDLIGFEALLADADLLITGEGSIDKQTLGGKGPFGVAQRAKNKSIPVIGFTGFSVEEDSPELTALFNEIVPISSADVSLELALKNTGENLIETAKKLGDRLAHTLKE
ncbi:MAG TPA: glycerate kinase [Chitinophagaceae bacterium]|nr:glycerate kinase [Chitinophagaceae bacterium]